MSIANPHPLSALAWTADQALALLHTHAVPVLIMAALGVLLVVLFTFHSAEPLPAPTVVPAAAPGPSILLVDDSAVARAKLLRLFRSAGYHAVVAEDGLQAQEALAREFFSVMVTDLEMPNMNGLELIAAVQGSLDTDDLPIIAVTGHDEMQARVQDLGGLYGIFKKPWNDRELLRRVESLAALRQRPLPPGEAGTDAAPSAAASHKAGRTPALHG